MHQKKKKNTIAANVAKKFHSKKVRYKIVS